MESEREREREKGEKEILKELAHAIVGTGRSETCRASSSHCWRPREELMLELGSESNKEAESLLLGTSFFFP